MPLDAVPFKRVLSVLNVKAEVVPPFTRMIRHPLHGGVLAFRR